MKDGKGAFKEHHPEMQSHRALARTWPRRGFNSDRTMAYYDGKRLPTYLHDFSFRCSVLISHVQPRLVNVIPSPVEMRKRPFHTR